MLCPVLLDLRMMSVTWKELYNESLEGTLNSCRSMLSQDGTKNSSML